jgi:hypothetical protein
MKLFTGDIELAHDSEFPPVIDQLIKEHNPLSIVETGTHKGTGSTLKLAQTGLPVFTIECNQEYFDVAKDNLSYYKNVSCIHGYSLPLKTMKEFIRNDSFYGDNKDLDIQVDDLHDPKEFYLKELGDNANLVDDLLIKYAGNNTKQIILLDSAGGVGYLEYKILMDFLLDKGWEGSKILVLDDILHVKHYRSIQDLKKRFGESIFHQAPSGRWGWAVLKDHK